MCGKICKPEKTLLFDTVILGSSPNSCKISQIIDDGLRNLKITRENLELLISDAAPYMVKAGRQLKNFYPKLQHITCLSHLIHNFCLRIKSYFPDIDFLIASLKAATVKNATRKEEFHHIGLPPNPIITRWGSWIEAAQYYSEHFIEVKRIVLNFDKSGILVEMAQQAVQNPILLLI